LLRQRRHQRPLPLFGFARLEFVVKASFGHDRASGVEDSARAESCRTW
jgi:hypothetical protein